MNRDEFFKNVLKQFFYEFAKTPATISWENDYKVYTIKIKLPSHDCYVRIYEDYCIMISSTNKGPIKLEEFDIELFKEKYKFISDEIPF